MADQKRWFKLWHSATSDDDLTSLPPAIRWAWAAFGAHTKVHGERGQVVVSLSNLGLAAAMGVTVEDLLLTIKSFPNMHVEEGQKRHGKVTVTWKNWVKYQEDSTQSQRQRSSRSKRRGEEKRVKDLNPAPDGADPGNSSQAHKGPDPARVRRVKAKAKRKRKEAEWAKERDVGKAPAQSRAVVSTPKLAGRLRGMLHGKGPNGEDKRHGEKESDSSEQGQAGNASGNTSEADLSHASR